MVQLELDGFQGAVAFPLSNCGSPQGILSLKDTRPYKIEVISIFIVLLLLGKSYSRGTCPVPQISWSMTGCNSHSHEKTDSICNIPFLPAMTMRVFGFLRLTFVVNFLDFVRAAPFTLSFGMAFAEKGLWFESLLRK